MNYRKQKPDTRFGGRGGFTVLEILVASALMVVIVGMVLGLSGTILRNWGQGTAELGRDAQLQQAYQLLQYDFESAVVTPDDRPWLWIEEPEAGWSLRWLRPAGRYDADDPAGLELVEWAALEADATGASTERLSLFRAAVSPDQWSIDYAAEGSVDVERPVEAFAGASDFWQAFVLGEVLSTELRVWVRDVTGAERALEDLGVATSTAVAFPLFAEGRWWRAPSRIDLELRIISADTAAQFDRLRAEQVAPETIAALLDRERLTVVWRLHSLSSR